MPKFTAEVKKVTTGKIYADPDCKIELRISDIEAIAYLSLLSLQENNLIDLEYRSND